MRQFLLGGAAYTNAASILLMAAGSVGFWYDKDGVTTLSADGSDLPDYFQLAVGRAVVNGGPITIPIHKNDLTFVKGVYEAPTTFVGTFTIPSSVVVGDYTVIIAKKGMPTNQRSKYSADTHVKDPAKTATQIAADLVKSINNNTKVSGVKATNVAGLITVTATTPGVDYEIIPADNLMGVTRTITTIGSLGYGSAKYVTDLANKAAADAGFSYTYDDGTRSLYPLYPLNPLAQPDSADVGFTIFSLRFGETTKIQTRDDVVYQIVQVAFPTGSGAIAPFEAALNAITGVTVDAGE